jgi:hypothetical protein
MVDAESLRTLARERGTSESEAVRDAVSFALASQDMVSALKGLHQVGAFADFQEMFGSFEEDPPARINRVAEQREQGF